MTSTWKAHEREVAKIMRGKRIPLSGSLERDSGDVEHKIFAVDVKHSKNASGFKRIYDWWRDLKQDQIDRRSGKVPMLALHRGGEVNYLAVIELHELMWLLEQVRKGEVQL